MKRSFEIEVDVGEKCEIYKYKSRDEAIVGAKTVSLFADEVRVYDKHNKIISKFKRGGELVSYSCSGEYKRFNGTPEDVDAIDPEETYGCINLGPHHKFRRDE